MKVELLFKNISELTLAYTKFEETVQVVQVLVADRSRTFIEPLHCFNIRFLCQFCHLLLVQLTQHHILLRLWQLMNREKERVLIAVAEKARLKN